MLCQIELAVMLGLPVLGPHPTVAKHFGLKTGARQLFRSAKVNCPPGVALDPIPPTIRRSRSPSSGCWLYV